MVRGARTTSTVSATPEGRPPCSSSRSRRRIPSATAGSRTSVLEPQPHAAAELEPADFHVGDARQVDRPAGVADEGPGAEPGPEHVVSIDLEVHADRRLALADDFGHRRFRAGGHGYGNELLIDVENRRPERERHVELVGDGEQPDRLKMDDAFAVPE